MMRLYGIECDKPKGEFCCFMAEYYREKNIFRRITEVKCRNCGAAWERREYDLCGDLSNEPWKMIRESKPWGKKIACKCGVSTNVEGIEWFNCKCGRAWTCLEDPGEDVNRRTVTDTWRIAEDIEEEPKGFVMVQDGELSKKKVDEINEFFAGWDSASLGKPIIIETKRNDKPVEDMKLKMDFTPFKSSMKKVGEVMRDSGFPSIRAKISTIRDMKKGECGYTISWATGLDFVVSSVRGGTFTEPIERTDFGFVFTNTKKEIYDSGRRNVYIRDPSPPKEEKAKTKRPDKYAPRPLSGDEKPERRWFWPAVLAIMTLLSGAAAVLTIADKWPSEPNHSLIETSIAPYIEAAGSIQFGYEREEDV